MAFDSADAAELLGVPAKKKIDISLQIRASGMGLP